MKYLETRNCLVCFLLIVWICFVDCLHNDQPRIVSMNGNLLFQTGTNYNISFKSSDGGNINFNGESFQALITMLRQHHEHLQQIISGTFTVPSSSLTRRVDDNQADIEELKRKVTTLSSNNPGLRRLTRKVDDIENRINEIELALTTNECNSYPCSNGGTCIDLYKSYACKCPPTWTGPRCADDVNECTTLAETDLGCQNGATCVNTQGGFRCICPENRYGSRCTEIIDDCQSSSNEALCGHGSCQNLPRTQAGQAKYKCHCDPGWRTDGVRPMCDVDVDECTTGRFPCSTNPIVQCINTPGSFVCGPCPSGYSGIGFTCTDIDECMLDNGGCSKSPWVECVNTLGSRSCGPCPSGYQGNGITCSYGGSCDVNNGGCHPLATCVGAPGIGIMQRRCVCPEGYVGDGEGGNGCLRPTFATPCMAHPCVHGTCQNYERSYVCNCYPHWTGRNCEHSIQACASNPCLNGGTCLDEVDGDFICICTEEFFGSHCDEIRQECGGSFEDRNGRLTFPLRGSLGYPNGATCSWIITTDFNQALSLYFERFSLERHEQCSYDFVKIFDGESTSDDDRIIGKYCGNDLIGRTVNSTSHVITIMFHSDHSETDEGFSVEWSSHSTECGGMIEDTHGVIKSPGYPDNYPLNKNCDWFFRGEPGIIFVFVLGQIDIGNCDGDVLEIRDGLDYHSPLLKDFCSSVVPPPVESTSNVATIRFQSDDKLTNKGFQISYFQRRVVQCGGRLTSDHGEVMSPNYPALYTHHIHCVWVISVPEGEKIVFNISHLDIEDHSDCVYDYLELREGIDESGMFIGRYCGNNTPPAYISNTNNLHISFKTDDSVTARGFHANWTTLCGGVYSDPTGEFHSPYYPNNYPSDKICHYTIRQPRGTTIILQFVSLILEEPHNTTCYDYVEVRDGYNMAAPVLIKYCGTHNPEAIMSTQSSLLVTFVSDVSIEFQGFKARYLTINRGTGDIEEDACGGTLRSPSGSINSPRHPQMYPPSTTCTWVITVPQNFLIRLSFISFHLEFQRDCIHDYVELFEDVERNSSLGRFCGHTLPPVTTSPSNTLVVSFVTDHSYSHEGFSASYVSFNASAVCGGELRSLTGAIISPRYPDLYPNNKICEWSINIPTGKIVILNVTFFQMEASGTCMYDYLEIRNGGHSTSPLIGKYCGDEIPSTFRSHTNKMFLKMNSDTDTPARGFRIVYSGMVAGCGGEITSNSGSFVSPNYPAAPYSHSECFWKITVSSGNTIKLHFVDNDFGDCRSNYIEIKLHEHDQEKQKYCSSIPDYIESKENVMIVMMKTIRGIGRGFHASYFTNCNNVLRRLEGAIESLNFPSAYPANLNCSYTIEVPQGNTINLRFTHFRLKREAGCEDYVEISEFDHVIEKLCSNSSAMHPINSSQTSIKVRFVSSNLLPTAPSGFRLEYKVMGCSGHLEGEWGNLTSPNYPRPYHNSKECIWIIKTSPQTRVQITILDLDIEEHHSCMYDSLEIYGGYDVTAPMLTKLCQTHTTGQTVISTGNFMVVRFLTDASNNGRGFFAHWNEMPNGCGGNFTAINGVITSQNYPAEHDHDTDCLWFITVQPGYRILFEFQDFDIEHSSSCRYDYVAGFMNLDFNNSEIFRMCGVEAIGQKFYSHDNSLVVRMRSDESIARRGFKASYTTVCGGRRMAVEDGEITSPGWPNNFKRSQNCSWNIVASSFEKKITFHFTHLSIGNSDGNCTEDYLEILDGEDLDAPSIIRLCGTRSPRPITTHGSSATVVFVSGNASPLNKGGFLLTYSESSSTCGGELSSKHGTFNSPNYPESYPSDVECVWNISTSIGSKIQLHFESMDIENSPDCENDFITLRDSRINDPRRICGSDLPSTATADNFLILTFRSNQNISGLGFSAHYSAVYGGNLIGDYGKISSPLHPRNYPDSSDNIWVVTGTLNKRIRVTFEAMDLEISNGQCFYDYIKLYDGGSTDSREVMRVCGTELPPVFESTSNQFVVRLVTDHSISRSGFLLSWEAFGDLMINPGSTMTSVTLQPGVTAAPQCGGDLVLGNTTITITSPNFPQRYSPLLDCVWNIHSLSGRFIKFQIIAISIESHPACLYDVLEVYSGPSDSEERLGKFCGHHLPDRRSTFIAHSNFARVRFATDGDTNAMGFQMRVLATCDRILTGTSGVILSPGHPGHYPSNENCTTYITVQPGNVIELTFNSMAISGVMPACNEDYLEIFDGPDNLSLSTRYCGHAPPTVYLSTSNSITLFFSSNPDPNTDYGFSIEYRLSQLSCGGEIDLTGELTVGHAASPHHPSRYMSSADCIWNVIAPTGTRIKMVFSTLFDIEYHVLCEYDHVEVRDGSSENSPLIDRFCGSQAPNDVISSRNSLWIRFRSDPSQSGYGFKATFLLAPCGGSISAAQGSLTSPNYPHPYPANASCQWIVTVPENHYITFSFEAMQIDDCNDTVTIHDYNSTGEVLLTACGNRLFPARDTPGNEAVVEFQSNAFNQSTGFKLNFVSIYEGCGGHEMGPTGIITSPGYPRSSPRKRRCSWIIKVDDNKGVKLTLEDVDLGYSCSNDYLMIKANIFDDSPVTHHMCRRYVTDVYIASNLVEVRLVNNEFDNGRGFKLEYSEQEDYTCSSFHDPTNQTIYSIIWPYGDYRPTSVDCLWVIHNPTRDNSTMTITFEQLSLNAYGRCYQNYVEIREGQVYEDPRMGKYCDFDKVPRHGLSSSSNGLVVRWKTFDAGTASLKIKYKFQPCGGHVASSTTFTNPTFESQSSEDTDCVWTIIGQEGSIIKVAIEVTAEHNTCNDSFLEILNGERFTSPSIMKICATEERKLLRTQSNKARIRFHSKLGHQTGIKFKITITFMTSGCGGFLQAPEGSLSAPSWPNYSNTSQSCFWRITTRDNFHLVLKFESPFQLTEGCIGSYLEVKEDPNHGGAVRRFCGEIKPDDVIVHMNKVDVRYQNWQNVSVKGFSLSYTSVCGWNFTGPAGTTGTIYPPGHPGHYEDNLNCEYFINIEAQLYTILYLESIQLPYLDYSTESCKDYLEISSLEGDVDPRKLCYSMYGVYFVVPGSAVVRFVTDADESETAWTLQYNVVDCNRELTDLYGRIISPIPHGFSFYPMNCSWVIKAPENKIIKIKFHSFQITFDSSCLSSYLAFFEFEPNGTSRLLGKFCGSIMPATFYSNTSKVQVVFVSASDGYNNFEIEYMAVYKCGGSISNSSGAISSLDFNNDGNYESDLNCKWVFDAPINKIYVIDFEYVTLPTGNDRECEDYVEIKHWFLENDLEALKICSSRNSFRYTSFLPLFSLEFVSDGETEARGFRATYKTIDQICGGEHWVNGSSQITIRSPDHPNGYHDNVNCKWVVVSLEHAYIEVDVTSLDILPSESCQDDYLKIEDVRTVNEFAHHDYVQPARNEPIVACGNQIPHSFVSSRNKVLITFVSKEGSRGRHKGFSLIAKEGSCNKNFTSATGRITSPFFPELYKHHTRCEIEIMTPPGTKLSIFFRIFELEYHSSCRYDFLKVMKKVGEQWSDVGTFCEHLPNPIFLRNNYAKLIFESDESNAHRGFDITYISSASGCGGDLKMMAGAITSPNYPNLPYQPNACNWTIQMPSNNNVILDIEILPGDVTVTDGCYNGPSVLKVFNGPDDTFTHSTYCRNGVTQLTQQTNNILIRYTSSDDEHQNIAFKLTFLGTRRLIVTETEPNILPDYYEY